MNERQVIICETADDVADAAADLILNLQTDALAARGVFRIALSGGGTPKLLYEALASDEWIHDFQWEAWEVFWSDERCVPPESIDSNFRLADDTLLQHVPVAENFRIRGEHSVPQDAAGEYARTIRGRFGPGIPAFDVILLGMGGDGHTASLFPGHPAINSPLLIEAVEVDQKIRHRITFTLNLLNSARAAIFLVTGDDKAARVKEILQDGNRGFPAAIVEPAEGECYWLLDHAAATLVR